MKKTFLIILMFSFIFLFFSCPNDSVEENPEEQLSSIIHPVDEFEELKKQQEQQLKKKRRI